MLSRNGMADFPAENYHLKWHSYGTHLYSTVATLLHTDSFTDITLVTVDGQQILAHRIVLSACSSFLDHLLHTICTRTSNSHPIVVLPSEINHQILNILIQYMYTGEATVGYEELDYVLKAAHILEIKGLSREKISTESINLDNKLKDTLKRQSIPQCISDLEQSVQVNFKASTSFDTNLCIPSFECETGKNDTIKSPRVDKNWSDDCESKHNSLNLLNNLETIPNNDIISNEVKEQFTNKVNTLFKQNRLSKNIVSSDSRAEIQIEKNNYFKQFVKQEPEWEPLDVEEIEEHCSKDPMHTEITIKPEIFDSEDGSSQYTPLSCDFCHKMFTSPAEWVRHIESHPETKEHSKQSKKNRVEIAFTSSVFTPGSSLFAHAVKQEFYIMDDVSRQSSGSKDVTTVLDNSDSDKTEDYNPEFPTLHCELCQQQFDNPGKWVRHVQTCHTKEQLAATNDKSCEEIDSKRSRVLEFLLTGGAIGEEWAEAVERERWRLAMKRS
uniref:Uncharacterized protein n=1 Tax=Timema shepardi TaxID=629360 RepID=A0A7R9B0C9_TIMSH|nr:unnamed protein product [Timema shepardi]